MEGGERKSFCLETEFPQSQRVRACPLPLVLFEEQIFMPRENKKIENCKQGRIGHVGRFFLDSRVMTLEPAKRDEGEENSNASTGVTV